MQAAEAARCDYEEPSYNYVMHTDKRQFRPPEDSWGILLSATCSTIPPPPPVTNNKARNFKLRCKQKWTALYLSYLDFEVC